MVRLLEEDLVRDIDFHILVSLLMGENGCYLTYKNTRMEHEALAKNEDVLESSKKHRKSKKEKNIAQEELAMPTENVDEEHRERPKKDRKLKRKAKDADLDLQKQVVIRLEERPKNRIGEEETVEEGGDCVEDSGRNKCKETATRGGAGRQAPYA